MLHKIKYETEPYNVNQYSVTVSEGKFAGVKYVLGKTELVEDKDNDNLTLKYHYDIIDSKIEDSDIPEFEKLIGDILMQMLSDGVKNNDLIYSGGVDAN
jgi:hypothetical protein